MKKILDFRNRSYSDVSGKYQNMEKPLKHQRRLGLLPLVLEIPGSIAARKISVNEHTFSSVIAGMTLDKCIFLRFRTLTGCPLCREITPCAG